MQALFRSVTETPEPIKARVKGKLPPWLKGSLLRVGPGQFEVGSQSYNHLFDGLALFHRFSIQEGEVTYQNRFERNKSFLRALQENRIVLTEFGTRAFPDPCKSIFSRYFSQFWEDLGGENNLVNLLPIRDEVYAMTEGAYIRRVDPQTLQSGKDNVDYKEFVAVHSMSAHPHVEPDGTIYNSGSRFGKDGVFALVKMLQPDEENNPLQKASLLCTIPMKWSWWGNYHHSFGLTDNYAIFVEQPMFLNFLKLKLPRFLSPNGYAGALEFYRNIPVQFHVIEKATGKVLPTRFLAAAFFLFHHVNAYEEGDQLVVDVCCYEKGKIIQDSFLENLRRGRELEPSLVKRYVLPLQKEKVCTSVSRSENLVTVPNCTATAVLREDGAVFCTPETLCHEPVELCQINYKRYNRKKYRYFYGVSSGRLDKLVKADIHTKQTIPWEEQGCSPSEPVFVPAPDGVKEDDGVVLSLVVRSSDEARSVFLLVLDGETFTELARAEAPSPAQACMTLHGIFLPGV